MPKRRCPWGESHPLYVPYHDREWGTPCRDDRALFELLVLEGAQAGLSWLTILKKREAFRRAFDGFDPERVARYGERQIARLLKDEGIIRNRLKIEAGITNARVFLEVQREHGSFAAWLWSLVPGAPIVHERRSVKEVPARTPESDALSEALRRRGFKFVGTTICYAMMQAAGLVNDHLVDCFRWKEVQKRPARPRVTSRTTPAAAAPRSRAAAPRRGS